MRSYKRASKPAVAKFIFKKQIAAVAVAVAAEYATKVATATNAHNKQATTHIILAQFLAVAVAVAEASNIVGAQHGVGAGVGVGVGSASGSGYDAASRAAAATEAGIDGDCLLLAAAVSPFCLTLILCYAVCVLFCTSCTLYSK